MTRCPKCGNMTDYICVCGMCRFCLSKYEESKKELDEEDEWQKFKKENNIKSWDDII